MPNKTIYVSDDDLALYRQAQELSKTTLSATITAALRQYIDTEEGRRAGFDEVIVKVGQHGAHRKQRFSGILLAEWGRMVGQRMEVFRVYRARSGKFAVHKDRAPEWTSSDADPSGNWIKELTNWRSLLGVSDHSWGFIQGESTLTVAEDLADLKQKIPRELYDMVVAAAAHPVVEDLDI